MAAFHRSRLAAVHVIRVSIRGAPLVVLADIQRPYAVLGLRPAVVRPGVALRVVRLRPVDLARLGSAVPGNYRAGRSRDRHRHCDHGSDVPDTTDLPGAQPAGFGSALVVVAAVHRHVLLGRIGQWTALG